MFGFGSCFPGRGIRSGKECEEAKNLIDENGERIERIPEM